MKTRTGSFPIGWRRRNYAWENDLEGMIAWAKENGLAVIDVGRDGDTSAPKVMEAGLKVGSVDLPVWGQGMITRDRSKRKDSIAQNKEYVEKVAPLGIRNFFVVMQPDDQSLPRKDNFALMVESFGELAPVLDAHKACIVIEGYPAHGTVVCTPETYAALFEQIPSPSMGINYDPSHLVRQGIDPLRFLREFVDRVYHVHAKDTRFIAENVYRYGFEAPGTFVDRMPYGHFAWRYTIPSHGLTDWVEVCQILYDNGYEGALSIELEDMYFDTNETSKLGILQAATFLSGC
jgi:sugar phosphate isomerase/epimerase